MQELTLLNGDFNYYPKTGASKRTVINNFPLGILYLGAYLEKYGYKVKTVNHENLRFQKGNEIRQVSQFVDQIDSDIIGISVTSISLPFILMALTRIKKKGRKIILGGPGTSSINEKDLEDFDFIDIVVKGEGELLLKKIMECFSTRYPGPGKIICSSKAGRLSNLDEIPFLDYEGWLGKKFSDVEGNIILPILSSRGCPYSCTFCSTSEYWQHISTYRDIDGLVKEISILKEKRNDLIFVFVDDIFTVKKKRLEMFCKTIIKEQPDVDWFCFSRIDSIDEPLMDLMKKAGCRLISFGVESGNDQVLKKIGKNFTGAEIKDTIIKARSIFDYVEVSFILGFPFESFDQYCDTLELMIECRKLNFSVKNYYLTPFISTPLFKNYHHLVKRDSHYINPSLNTPRLDNKEIREFFNLYPRFSVPFGYYDHSDFEKKIKAYNQAFRINN